MEDSREKSSEEPREAEDSPGSHASAATGAIPKRRQTIVAAETEVEVPPTENPPVAEPLLDFDDLAFEMEVAAVENILNEAMDAQEEILRQRSEKEQRIKFLKQSLTTPYEEDEDSKSGHPSDIRTQTEGAEKSDIASAGTSEKLAEDKAPTEEAAAMALEAAQQQVITKSSLEETDDSEFIQKSSSSDLLTAEDVAFFDYKKSPKEGARVQSVIRNLSRLTMEQVSKLASKQEWIPPSDSGSPELTGLERLIFQMGEDVSDENSDQYDTLSPEEDAEFEGNSSDDSISVPVGETSSEESSEQGCSLSSSAMEISAALETLEAAEDNEDKLKSDVPSASGSEEGRQQPILKSPDLSQSVPKTEDNEKVRPSSSEPLDASPLKRGRFTRNWQVKDYYDDDDSPFSGIS